MQLLHCRSRDRTLHRSHLGHVLPFRQWNPCLSDEVLCRPQVEADASNVILAHGVKLLRGDQPGGVQKSHYRNEDRHEGQQRNVASLHLASSPNTSYAVKKRRCGVMSGLLRVAAHSGRHVEGRKGACRRKLPHLQAPFTRPDCCMQAQHPYMQAPTRSKSAAYKAAR